MRPTKSTGAFLPGIQECASGRDELKMEIEMDRQRLTLSRDETRASGASARGGGGNQEHAAREFYQGVLGGRQVWPTGPRAAARKLWFLVGSSLLPVGLAPVADVVELCVDSPAAIAERCWDAGHTVRPRTDNGDDFIVIDPFGRQIVLTRRASVCPFGVGAAG